MTEILPNIGEVPGLIPKGEDEVDHHSRPIQGHYCSNWALQHIPIIPALGRMRQEDHEFKASLCYTVSSRLSYTERKQKKEKEGGGGRERKETREGFDFCPAPMSGQRGPK